MKYISKKLTIDKVKLQDIADKFDTPAYCYSYSQLKKILMILKKILNRFHL